MSTDTTIADELKDLLAEHDVTIENRPRQMIEFRAVPLGDGFSKTRANVMLWKRDNWRLFVDDDVKPIGDEPAMGGLLPGPAHNQWQPLNPAQKIAGDINTVLLTALELLDSPLSEIAASLVDPHVSQQAEIDETDFDLRPSWHGELLDVRQFEGGALEPTGSQRRAVRKAVAAILRNESPICPILVGDSGSGKGIASRLAALELVSRGEADDVFVISGASLHAGVTYESERDERLTDSFSFAQTGTKPLVIFEHVDMLLASTRLARALMAEAIDRGIRLIGVAQPDFDYRRLRKSGALPRRIKAIRVDGADPSEMMGVIAKRLENWPLANDLEVLPEAVSAAISLSSRESAVEPAATMGLLEAVLIDARERRLTIVGPDEVFYVASENVY